MIGVLGKDEVFGFDPDEGFCFYMPIDGDVVCFRTTLLFDGTSYATQWVHGAYDLKFKDTLDDSAYHYLTTVQREGVAEALNAIQNYKEWHEQVQRG
jgi:hypothetical protein